MGCVENSDWFIWQYFIFNFKWHFFMYNMCIFGINPEYFWLLQITLYYYITHVFRIFDFDLKLAQISARVTTCNIGRHYTLVTHFAIIAHLPPPVACLPVSYMYIKMYIKRSQNGIFLQMIRRSVWTPIYWLSISECRRWYIWYKFWVSLRVKF